jgi:type IV secretory pathway VirB2 component (pilin)
MLKKFVSAVRRSTTAVVSRFNTPASALAAAAATGLVLVAEPASAATTGTAFQPFYTFIDQAATGYLGRGIAITGGVIGLGTGAAMGKPLLAAVGIVLAIFGALGPTIADTIFNTAVI